MDAGADLIFGHSRHVFRGIEIYKGRLIVYGAGDFIDDYAVDPVERNDHAFIYIVEMENSTPRRLLLYPTLIRRRRACLATGLSERIIVEKMKELCTAFHTPANWNEKQRRLEIEVRSQEMKQ